MRDFNTQSMVFRELLKELASLMTFEITRDVAADNVRVKTPLDMETDGMLVEQSEIVLIPVLRAGIGMTGGVLTVIPRARVGHIGIYREPETLEAVQYYNKLPSNLSKSRLLILIDPMLATGHTMAAALDICKKAGAKNMRIMCLVAAPEGIKEVRKSYPEIPIYTAAVDEKLNEHGYILPGLGDAGDRIFGTK